ncbi:MAG: TonB-dependent receptor [Tannerella sp.]|jgi:hypothetical protein|nr:TonB-dependent receptor [Tannerella sp.]
MKKNKIYALATGFMLFLTTVAVSAQQPDTKEDINRQMTLEREYDPTIMDASKINTLPKVREMVVQQRPIVYSDYTLPLHFENEITVLPSGTFMTDIERYANKGYLHLAAGMLMNFTGDFGYHLLDTERDDLRFHFSHRSTNGNVQSPDAALDALFGKRKAKLNDNLGGLDFKHAFDALTLSLGGSAGFSAFNYYGMPTNISNISTFPAGSSDSITNQANRNINLYANIASTIQEKLGYHLGVDYTNFNQKYALAPEYKGITENNIGLDFGLNSPVKNEQCFGIDVKLNILNYSAPELPTALQADSINFGNRYELTFSPYYKLDRESLKLLLGVNLMMVSQQETDFLVSPNIQLDVPFSTSSVFYVDLGGGIESNTVSQISRINRYVNPAFPPDASKTWLDGQMGVRSSVATGLWLNIFGGYKYTEADVFFNPSMYDWIDNGFNNVSMAYQPNSQRLQIGASLKYDYKSIFGFYLKGAYNHYTLTYADSWKNRTTQIPDNDDIQAYGKPNVTVNLGLYAKPAAPLTFNLDYNMLSGIYAYYNGENVKMKPVNDLRLRGSWQFNNTFSLYAQLNNLLFQRQELIFGYPLQPFTAMVGFNVNF